MPDAPVRIMLFTLPRIVSDLLHAAADGQRDVVLIDRADRRSADLAGDAVAAEADVVVTATETEVWPAGCAQLVVARSPLAVYAVDTSEGVTCTLESHGLGELSPDELLVAAIARARAAR